MLTVRELCTAAKAASRVLAVSGTAERNRALAAIADALEAHEAEILAANAEDTAAAAANGMRASLLDRLTLNHARLASAAQGVREVMAQEDPIGGADSVTRRPNGLRIERRRVPLGVVGIIYEARPNVTVDAAVLCLKAGSACILRGGKEAIRSNRKAVELMREAVASAGLPEDCVSLVQSTDRETARELMHLENMWTC